MCPAEALFSWSVAPILALGATAGLGGGLGLAKDEISLTEELSLGGRGLGAGTGTEVPDWRASVGGFGVTEGFSVVLQGWATEVEPDLVSKDGGGSLAVCEISVVFTASVLHESAAVKPSSSQNCLKDGFGVFEKFLGLGATMGGTDLAGCPWRRGRGRGSGLFETTESLFLLSPQLPSATGCCSNACILAFRVPISSSSLSDWLCSLLSL